MCRGAVWQLHGQQRGLLTVGIELAAAADQASACDTAHHHWRLTLE